MSTAGANWPEANRKMVDLAEEEVRLIKPPENLTLEELHEFWIWVEVIAYYQRKTCLANMAGSFEWEPGEGRMWMVGTYFMKEDKENLEKLEKDAAD
jgi:hypothetical protein